jgi:hypothetical protein
MKHFLLFVLLLLNLGSISQQGSLFPLNALPPDGVLLDQGWKYHAGDNPTWASPGFDDQAWPAIDPTQDIHDLQPLWKHPVGCFDCVSGQPALCRGRHWSC